MAYRLSAIIDASAVVTDAAGSSGDTGEPVTDTCSMTADTGTIVKHSRSITKGLRAVSVENVLSSQAFHPQPLAHFDTRTGAQLVCDNASECLGAELQTRYFPGAMNPLAALSEEYAGIDLRPVGTLAVRSLRGQGIQKMFREMTGYIDDISSSAAILLLMSAIATALFRRSFPSSSRILSFLAVGTAATITFLLIIVIVAIATSPPPRFARYDGFCAASAVLTFLPAQLLWLRSIRQRILFVAGLACLSLAPTFLSMALLRSSADPFYISHP